MRLSRRQFFAAGAGLGLGAAQKARSKSLDGLRIGVTDWNLKLSGKIEALRLAKRVGFEGVEISLGRTPVDGKLALDNSELQKQYLTEASKLNIALAGTCLNILHVNYLKNDKLGQKWLGDGIPITKKLNAQVMLLPFFGKGAPETPREKDYVGDILREFGPEAEKAGVILGLEDTLSAEDNVRIMERSRSRAVKVFYDVGNSTRAGYDILKEIPWLGTDRIGQFHLKDNPHYIGEGTVDFPAVIDAIANLEFRGFADLETSSPSGSVEADMRRNFGYIRRFLETAKRSQSG